MQNLVTRFY